ncbi:hypothetical protein ACJRO7_002245 [Eucalyptus globulus]|uniref:Dolichol-phosphate mannosyltransferase subunit 3 n=1 Tax=Eucalyptus globulus TaxID=34317 RepID=A0ABD3LTS3_EUCGL
MKHILKIIALLVTISAMWIGLLEMSVVPQNQTWLLPIYFIVSLGCYGLLMVGIGLMHFPTCPHEAVLLQQVFRLSKFLKFVIGQGSYVHNLFRPSVGSVSLCICFFSFWLF